jgi:hypothetical protein
MDRQEGYYWVKVKGNLKHEIAFYNKDINGWLLMGIQSIGYDNSFEHINEVRIKEPGELPN